MYRITRTATLKNASVTPKAIGWSTELNKFINDNYNGFNLKVGVEMFGHSCLHWSYETESLAKLEEANARLLQDKKYWAMLDAGKEFWVDGSLKDTIVMVVD